MNNNKRKAEVVDLSDDRDEAVFEYIEQCTEISTLKSIINSTTKRLSCIGLGVVMESSNYYSNKVINTSNGTTTGEYFVGNFLVGSLQKLMQIEIVVAKSSGNGCSTQLKCMWETESNSKKVPLFTYQFQNEQYSGHSFFPFQGYDNDDDDDEDVEDQVYMVDDENITLFITSCQLQNIAPSRYQATLNGFATDIKLKCIFADIIVDAMKALSTKFHFRVRDYFSKAQCRFAFDDEIFWEYLFPSDSSSEGDDNIDVTDEDNNNMKRNIKYSNIGDDENEDENEMNDDDGGEDDEEDEDNLIVTNDDDRGGVNINEDEQEDIGEDTEDGVGNNNNDVMPRERQAADDYDIIENDQENDVEEEEQELLVTAHADDDEDINEDSVEEEQAKHTVEAVLDGTMNDNCDGINSAGVIVNNDI